MFAPKCRRSVISFRYTKLGWVLVFAALVGCASTGGDYEEVADLPGSDEVIDFKFPLGKYRRFSRGFKGRHRGIDVSAPKGTPIFASEAGWVTYAGRKFSGYGKLIIVEHSTKWATFYAHMNDYAVKEGSWVKKGDVIGYVGRTGRASGDHLHFEIRYNNRPIDPMPYFDRSQIKFAGN